MNKTKTGAAHINKKPSAVFRAVQLTYDSDLKNIGLLKVLWGCDIWIGKWPILKLAILTDVAIHVVFGLI